MAEAKPRLPKRFPLSARANKAILRRNSRGLALLSAITTKSIRISAVLVAASAPWPRTKKIRRWQYDVIESVPEIDLERILADQRERSRLSHAIREIRKRRFARLVRKKNRYVLEVTEEGQRRVLPHRISRLIVPAQSEWDGLWRIVLFDIPERRRTARNALRDKLRELGFFLLQKSAFVLPYPCEDALDAIVQHFRIQRYVTFFKTDSLGYQEALALSHFHLTRGRRETKRKT